MENLEQLKQNALWMRKRILELALKSGSSGAHIGGSLSLVEVLAALYSSSRRLRMRNR